MTKRDDYLDFYRGIAVISIVFIHTVFGSGGSYVPDFFKTTSLLLDVPFFVFLSGWSTYYSHNVGRTFDNLLKVWFKWVLFITITDFSVFVVWGEIISPTEWLNQCFFYVGDSLTRFPVVGGSLWYMPMYILISLTGTIIINWFQMHDNIDCKICRRVILFLFIGVCYLSAGIASSWFLLSRYFCFYMAFFLLGYCSLKLKIDRIYNYVLYILMIFVLWYVLSRVYGIPARNLQLAKFPPHVIYFMASMLSVTSAIFFRGKLGGGVEKCRLLRYIGKNALCFYFAQGIGSSVIFSVVPIVFAFGWGVTLLVCFLLNLAITLIIGCALTVIYRLIGIGLNAISQRFKIW
jgi:hypothetical protein